MEIAQVCPRYPPYMGGVENHVKMIADNLTDQNYHIHVLTTDPSGNLPKKEMIGNVLVKRFAAFAPKENYHFSTELWKYLRKKSCDYQIVHSHSYHDMPALYSAISKRNNKLVLTPHFHGTVGHSFFRSLLHVVYKPIFGRRIFNEADRIICNSKFEETLIRKAFGGLENKIQYLREPLLFEDLRKLNRSPQRENGEADNTKNLLCVSRIEKYKNIQYLVRALSILPRFIKLRIVGKGPFKPELERLVATLKLGDRVLFLQDLTKEEMIECYAKADLGVLLSSHESYGLFVAEVLGSGLPCIVANTSALSQWINEGNCIGVNYPLEVEEIAQAILEGLKMKTEKIQLPTINDYINKLKTIYFDIL